MAKERRRGRFWNRPADKVQQMLADHPDRAELIKQEWTEESLAIYLSSDWRRAPSPCRPRR